MHEFLIKKLKNKLNLFIEASKKNYYFKNFIIKKEYIKYVPKNIKKISYKNLGTYITNNKRKKDILLITDIDEYFSLKNKYTNNILFYKNINGEKINFNFILVSNYKIEDITINGILFM